MSQAKAEALGGYTPTQALIKHFTDTGIKHFVRQLSGHVTALIWTYPWCEKAWKRFPDVLSLDNTYKTNRFDMPFLNVTGVTNLHTTFNVAFAMSFAALRNHFPDRFLKSSITRLIARAVPRCTFAVSQAMA